MRMIITTSAAVLAVGLTLLASGCAASSPSHSGAGTGANTGADTAEHIVAVGAENQYTSVIAQLGGKYVSATSVMSNPNTDPHTFEASATVASAVSSAVLIVQNGLGYDSFMSRLEAASPRAGRVVITAQASLGLSDGTRNPHLWYDPKTMPVVARDVTAALTKLQPRHAGYFAANLARFTSSLAAWTSALARFRTDHPQVAVATTEPVADYMLEAAGTRNLTPWAFQAAIMNATDPAPQDVELQNQLFSKHRVKVFVYNQQVNDAITSSYLKLAKQNHVPVVGVYETMPTDGLTYQSWMEAELHALERAVTTGVSTVRL